MCKTERESEAAVNTQGSAQRSAPVRRGGMRGGGMRGGVGCGAVGGRLRREWIHTHLELVHAVIQQKPTQHCKAIVLRLKTN